MAINPYQFESAGGYGLGTSTNYGGNEYGYDIGSGTLGISDQSNSDSDFDRNKKIRGKKPNPSTTNIIQAASVLSNVSAPVSVPQTQSQTQTQAQTQTQTQAQTQAQTQTQTQTQTQPTVIPQTQSQKAPDRYGSTGTGVSKTSPTISYKSETLPTIGYGDAGAAQAAASQAGAGSVTPEQSSQWRMQQAQEANQRAHSTPRDYSSITAQNEKWDNIRSQNKAAHSTPRDYSSLSSQFKSPELPTIQYGDAGAAQAAASQAGAGKSTAYIGNYDILKGMDPGKNPQDYWRQAALVEPDAWRSRWYNESGLTAPQKLIAQDIMEQNSAYNPSTKTMYDLTTGEPTSWQPTIHEPGSREYQRQAAFGVDPLPKGGKFSPEDVPWAEMANTSPTNTTKALFDRSASVDNRYSGQTAYNAAGQRGAAGVGVLAQASQGMSGLSSQFSPSAGKGITIGRGQSGSTAHAPYARFDPTFGNPNYMNEIMGYGTAQGPSYYGYGGERGYSSAGNEDWSSFRGVDPRYTGAANNAASGTFGRGTSVGVSGASSGRAA